MNHGGLIFRFAFFLCLSTIAIFTPIVVFSLSDNSTIRLVVSGICALSLVLGFRVAIFTGATANRVRLAVLAVAGALFFSVLQFGQRFAEVPLQLLNIATQFMNSRFGYQVPLIPLGDPVTQIAIVIAVLVALIVVVALVLWSLRPLPAMGKPETGLAEVFPAVTNFDRLDIFKRTLRDRLDQLDHETRWNANYVPLEAEVQILEGRTSRRRIVDLLSALRRDQRTRLFLVLGDPGTGKSVAMRKLARDLLSESGRADRIPIYVNLREWRTDKVWTPDNPPMVEEFFHFLFHNVMQYLDFNSQAFLRSNDNFRRLFEKGYFFFILDSFDEIPAVLDHEESSWLIEALSNCVVTCVLGGVKLARRNNISLLQATENP